MLMIWNNKFVIFSEIGGITYLFDLNNIPSYILFTIAIQAII